MKRLMLVVGLLAFAGPAFASEPEQSTLDEPALMTDAEFDDVVAGGNGYAWGHYKNGKSPLFCIIGSNVAVNVLIVNARGNSTVNVTQIALAGSTVVLGGTTPSST